MLKYKKNGDTVIRVEDDSDEAENKIARKEKMIARKILGITQVCS